jgi:tetratricopeptide (TPR) repeat protein
VASRQAGQRLSALIELRTALALARRQGHRLPPILIELETLRQELATSPPVVIDEPISASTLLAPLSHLLAAELFHPAEELAGALLDEAQPPSLLASLPSLLALRVPLLSGLAAAQHGRGRSDLALAPLEQALTLINEELAAAPHRAELWLTRAELLGRLAAVVPLP